MHGPAQRRAGWLGSWVGGWTEQKGGLFPRVEHHLADVEGAVGSHHLTAITVNSHPAKAPCHPQLLGRVSWGAGCWLGLRASPTGCSLVDKEKGLSEDTE